MSTRVVHAIQCVGNMCVEMKYVARDVHIIVMSACDVSVACVGDNGVGIVCHQLRPPLAGSMQLSLIY